MNLILRRIQLQPIYNREFFSTSLESIKQKLSDPNSLNQIVITVALTIFSCLALTITYKRFFRPSKKNELPQPKINQVAQPLLNPKDLDLIVTEKQNAAEAWIFFEKLKKLGNTPSPTTYKNLLNLLIKNEEEGKAFIIFEEMKKCNLLPTLSNETYHDFLKLLTNKKDVTKISSILPILLEQKADEKLIKRFYKSLIIINTINKNVEVALKWFNKLEEFSPGRNSVYLNWMIEFLYEALDADKVDSVLAKMKDLNMKLNLAGYQAGIRCYIQKSDVEKVWEFYGIRNQRLKIENYPDLIGFFIQKKKIVYALEILKNYKTENEENLPIKDNDLSQLIKNLAETCDIDHAWTSVKLIQTYMTKENTPNHHTDEFCPLLIDIFIDLQEEEKMWGLFAEIKRLNIKLAKKTYDKLCDFYLLKIVNETKGWEIIQEMKNTRIIDAGKGRIL